MLMNKTVWIILIVVPVVIAGGYVYAEHQKSQEAMQPEEGAMMQGHATDTMMASSSDHMMATTSKDHMMASSSDTTMKH